MCRVEMEADTGASMEKLVPSLSGVWRCPGCQEDRSTYACTTCDVRRNVIIAATQTALPFFDLVDALFFDFLGHHERKRRGQAASVHELELLYFRIDFIMTSQDGQQLLQNSWMIREGVVHLLKQAYKGVKTFTFSAPFMDNNSKALYVLLIDRLKAKIKILNVSSAGITFELPSFAPNSVDVTVEWACPLCTTVNDADDRACNVCGCESKTLIIAESHDEMQNVKRIFDNVESLVFRAFDIMSDRQVSDGLNLSCSAALQVLRKEVDVFFNSLDVRRVEYAGWKIKCHLLALFDGLCDQQTSVPFQYYSDVTSAGLYAVLVRNLRIRLADDQTRIPSYGPFRIDEPQPNILLKQDEEYEPLTGQRFYVHGQTFGLLQSQRKFFIKVAHLVAQKASKHYWVGIVECRIYVFIRLSINTDIMVFIGKRRKIVDAIWREVAA